MTGRRTSLAALAALVVLTGGATACRKQNAVATLLERTGTVERGVGGGWQDAPLRTGFAIGDLLRTGAASSARLRVAGGGVIHVGENSRLRFRQGTVAGQAAPEVGVELGVAEVDSEDVPLSLVTSAGPARVQRGTRVRVRADDSTASLEVLVGRAMIIEQGREVPVEAGRGIRISLGNAAIERFEVKVGQAIVDRAAQPDAGTGAAKGPDAGAVVLAVAPVPEAAGDAGPPPTVDRSAAAATVPGRAESSHADVTIAAGESPTLHDARVALAVRVRFGDLCTGEAIFDLGGPHGQRLTGVGAVVVRLRAGTQSYHVRCAGDGRKAAPRASGVLSLRRDTGNVPLSRRPPANVIDADGRRYTVLFQSRLPQLTFVWPSAPEPAPGLELHVESASGARVLPMQNTKRPLPAGTLQEGTYTLWYSTASGKTSAKTTVNIRFDNAAPTAQFFRVAAGGASDAISVDGVTVDGAKVSVGGQSLPVDAHGRFRGVAAPSDGDAAIAVRLEHPRSGVHYYVRRRDTPSR